MGAEYFVRQVARRLDIPVGEVGTAGLKDRHAVTRQMVSVPAAARSRARPARRRRHPRAERQPARQQAQAGPPARQPLPHPRPRRRPGRRPSCCRRCWTACGATGCRISTARSASAATARRCRSAWRCCATSRRRPPRAGRNLRTRSCASWRCRRRSRRCSTTTWPAGMARRLAAPRAARRRDGEVAVRRHVRRRGRGARAGALRRPRDRAPPARCSAARCSPPPARPRRARRRCWPTPA